MESNSVWVSLFLFILFEYKLYYLNQAINNKHSPGFFFLALELADFFIFLWFLGNILWYSLYTGISFTQNIVSIY